jgi:methylated-DNA-[protein]-cysteine S-methyltransferase
VAGARDDPLERARWVRIIGAILKVSTGGVMGRHSATVCFASSLGVLEVEAAESGVTRVRIGGRCKPREVGDGGALALAQRTAQEITDYLAGSRRRFTVPVAAEGTPFQKAVWAELARIPYGKRRTYGELAAALGRPRGARAVGAACGANPVPVLVPCHRVVGADGSMGGFGAGLAVKAKLLDIERDGVDAGR